ncbi:MAG: trypsin-like peptidase domain-containing protein [Candidatus Theseobacter exili]|nr:trypsin-like peptidase domain-containing protein [Candidatus Theseobacter exili]
MIFLLSTNGCNTTSVPERRISYNSCNFIYRKKDFHECLSQANAGDAHAAFGIAKIYEKGKYFSSRGSDESLSVERDRKTAFHWYKVSADLGYEKALRTVFYSYCYGRYGPENRVKAESYLIKASNMGHEWAMLLLAHRSEKSDPEKVMNLYLQLASMDNCHAQGRLAELYLEGKIVPKDPCKAYFWALLARVGWPSRKCPIDGLLFATNNYDPSYSVKDKSEATLDPEYIEVVQDAASKWKKGQTEPDLPTVQTEPEKKPFLAKIIPPDSIKVSKLKNKEKPLEWIPADIDLSMQLKTVLTPSQIFELINPSVWTVISASTAKNLKAMNNISIASAVAISENKLLTNYHIIEKKPYVLIKHGEEIVGVVIYAGDKQRDQCILLSKGIKLKPVKGFRKYNQLSVGDTVYSVGSPQGLENSLGQGLVSGKRELGEQKIIQTTAPISQGSSGGGLFDRAGNLIGITTFKIIDSEGLNFAISIEDFSQ